MAVLTVQSITPIGTSPSYVAANLNGDKVRPSNRTFLHVKNGSGGSVTVTVDDTITKEPVGAVCFDPDLEVTIEGGGERFIGPIDPARFRGEDGNADISYDSVASVTVAALRI